MHCSTVEAAQLCIEHMNVKADDIYGPKYGSCFKLAPSTLRRTMLLSPAHDAAMVEMYAGTPLLVHWKETIQISKLACGLVHHSSSLCIALSRPLLYPSLLPLKVSLSFWAWFPAPEAIGVVALEIAGVDRPSTEFGSSKSCSSGCFSVSSLSFVTQAACTQLV